MIQKLRNNKLKCLTVLLTLAASTSAYSNNIGLNDIIMDNPLPYSAANTNMQFFFNTQPSVETCFISLFAYPTTSCTGALISSGQRGSATLSQCRSAANSNQYIAGQSYQIFYVSAFRALGSLTALDNTQSILAVTTRQDAATTTGSAYIEPPRVIIL